MNPLPSNEMAVGFLDLRLYSPGGLTIPDGLLGMQQCKWLFGTLPTIDAKVLWAGPSVLKCFDKNTGDELPETDLTGQILSFIAFGQ
jgi:hypothetical protein